jgi:hypothetical protein
MPPSSRWSSYGEEDNQTYPHAWDEADLLPDFTIVYSFPVIARNNWRLIPLKLPNSIITLGSEIKADLCNEHSNFPRFSSKNTGYS